MLKESLQSVLSPRWQNPAERQAGQLLKGTVLAHHSELQPLMLDSLSLAVSKELRSEGEALPASTFLQQ